MLYSTCPTCGYFLGQKIIEWETKSKEICDNPNNTKEEKEVIMKSDSAIENKIKSFVHKKIEGDHLVSAAGIDRFDFYHKVHKYDKDSLVELTIFIANKLGSGR